MPQIPLRIKELTVGQLSARSGAAVSALRFYEAKGLISSRRTAGNQRRYGRDALRRVSFIRAAQRVGIPLAAVREALASLPEERTPDREDWARLSERWRADLDERIQHLVELRDRLSDCIGCGCLSLDRCALSNPYDQLGAGGSGARRLRVDGGGPGRPRTAAAPAADVPRTPSAAGAGRPAMAGPEAVPCAPGCDPEEC
ncbi:redox-sensitive transcriptional activator SoxR [Streptomyces pactum]|uniref:Redox-sensitive transcriptional activator SoxR n=1 Tax=Streptomyces pactum TaxID=68249 RepID=A0ABS0NG03_9ACTN|nr:redox-sensitive transcriptional activator SoxR [Streptomyces pactum]MBH5334109.1 redox-sensitive transcriptional activator SoxR [Streptomyces pactum]